MSRIKLRRLSRTRQPEKLIFQCLVQVLILVIGMGCASLPTDYIRSDTIAIQEYEQTDIGKRVAGRAANHPGDSGFKIIRYSRPAFTSRIMFSDLAEKTLDLQYYIWEADTTGRILADRLVQAADRGIRVRVLLDDINLSGRDAPIASIDAHLNIEIRVFNPFARRSARFFDFFTDFERVNHRMHNKVMIVDNAVAIVGGRNIGNHYFGVDTEDNFRDLDILAAGPMVRDISLAYDTFWNGAWSIPIAALQERPYTENDLRETMESMRRQIAENDYPYPLESDVDALTLELASSVDSLIWAPGRIVYDGPAAIYDENARGNIKRGFFTKLESLQKELLIESAYFVVRKPGLETVRQLHDRGARMRVLTNSLVSNDVLAAHAGYAENRAELLKYGVELYELRPDARFSKKDNAPSVISVKSKAALHTKTMVFDRESLFIGSYNLDPRSANINTEAGVYDENKELAAQVIDYMDEGVKPENSYRVLLDEDGDLEWVSETNGQEVRYHKDPESGFWQRFMSGFIQLLPVEEQL